MKLKRAVLILLAVCSLCFGLALSSCGGGGGDGGTNGNKLTIVGSGS
jgi:ABC-type phosphate transport system substrate-binding protein